ncbi:VOC family protein [Jannaschia sp. R86511]|uniref:VOC family protein n=1 Tax=Jannaschia sp. R86511 TaxID=3093853 RepID=UPI0036D37689
MTSTTTYPTIRQVVLDTTDPRGLAEFYRALFGLAYRPGDEPPAPGEPDPNGEDWLVLQARDGGIGLAFQMEPEHRPSTWPEHTLPQQLHLDSTVADAAELQQVHERALALGARPLLDRTDDPDEPLRVYADPAGHPFCVFVGQPFFAGAGTVPRERATSCSSLPR